MKVVLDTNFLMSQFQFKIDVMEKIPEILEEKAEFVILEQCVRELVQLADSYSKDSSHAKAALNMIKAKNLPVEHSVLRKNVDDAILEYAVQNKAIVSTNDARLKSKAKSKGLQVISLRDKSALTIE